MKNLSFIILRHIGKKSHNIYWNICYDRIRKFYPNIPIYIIDDNSKIKPKRIGKKKLINTTIINSKFPPNRGELLPYYYYYTKKFSKNTVILHDTVFLNKKIDSRLLKTDFYHFLWTAGHKWDDDYRIKKILSKMNDSKKLISIYNNKLLWDVCFGGMCILNLKYLEYKFNKTNYFNVLLNIINNRRNRMLFERIISILLFSKMKLATVNGNIHYDQKWNSNLISILIKMKFQKRKKMFKVWVGR